MYVSKIEIHLCGLSKDKISSNLLVLLSYHKIQELRNYFSAYLKNCRISNSCSKVEIIIKVQKVYSDTIFICPLTLGYSPNRDLGEVDWICPTLNLKVIRNILITTQSNYNSVENSIIKL